MAHIGIDLDGVCYNFSEDARLVVADHLDTDPEELSYPETWDFWFEQWGIDSDKFWRLWYDQVDNGDAWFRLPPIEGTIDGLAAIRDAGHKVHIVTSRKGGEVNTSRWLRTYKVPYDMVHIGKHKTRVNVDLLVDDWEENWRMVNESGGRCLVWDQPWNNHIQTEDRVFSWEDVLEKINED